MSRTVTKNPNVEFPSRDGGPAQGRFGAAAPGGFHQHQQCRHQVGILLRQGLASRPGPTHPAQRLDTSLQLGHSLLNARTRRPGRPSHRGNPAMAQAARLRGQKQTHSTLTQVRQDRLKLHTQQLIGLSGNRHTPLFHPKHYQTYLFIGAPLASSPHCSNLQLRHFRYRRAR